jgi:hypothetical protein
MPNIRIQDHSFFAPSSAAQTLPENKDAAGSERQKLRASRSAFLASRFVWSGARFKLVFYVLLPLAYDLRAILPEISFASTKQDSFDPPAEFLGLPRLGRDNFNPQQLRNLLQGQSGH